VSFKSLRKRRNYGELFFVETTVELGSLQKLFVGTEVGDPAPVYYEDLIRSDDRREDVPDGRVEHRIHEPTGLFFRMFLSLFI